MGACRQFAHQLMICECLASIELGIRQHSGLRFISWQEIIAKAPERTRISGEPIRDSGHDIAHAFGGGMRSARRSERCRTGCFGLEYVRDGQRLYRFFALEADRNTVPIKRSNVRQSSYLRKVLAYRQIVAQDIQKTLPGECQNLIVLTVTNNERHMRNIMAMVEELAVDGKSSLFLFRTIEWSGGFPASAGADADMLTAPWQRVGYEPLAISEP